MQLQVKLQVALEFVNCLFKKSFIVLTLANTIHGFVSSCDRIYFLCEGCWVSVVILLIIIGQPEKTATTQIWAMHFLDLGSDVSPVWNFCTHFSDFISRENQLWHRGMSTVFLGQSLENENKLGRNNLIVDLNG